MWKVIEENTRYEVSEDGQVRNRTTLAIKSVRLDKSGYPTTTLTNGWNKPNKRVSVHRLVAKAFIPNPEKKKEVNHKNGIKSDTRVENLEWCTRQENYAHARETGLMDRFGSKGYEHPKAKLTEEQAQEILNLKGKVYQKDLAKTYGVSESTISMIQIGRRWSHLT